MQSLVLYLGMMAIGVVVGTKTLDQTKEYPWIGRIQSVALILLILALGIELGADDRVISSLSEIGISSLVLTAFCVTGSVVFVYFARKWLGLNRFGVPVKKSNEGPAVNGTDIVNEITSMSVETVESEVETGVEHRD